MTNTRRRFLSRHYYNRNSNLPLHQGNPPSSHRVYYTERNSTLDSRMHARLITEAKTKRQHQLKKKRSKKKKRRQPLGGRAFPSPLKSILGRSIEYSIVVGVGGSEKSAAAEKTRRDCGGDRGARAGEIASSAAARAYKSASNSPSPSKHVKRDACVASNESSVAFSGSS